MKNRLLISKHSQARERFDEKKFIMSIINSCLAVGCPMGEAEKTAELTLALTEKWLANKQEITSSELRLNASRFLKKFSPDAGFYYKNYKKIM